MRDACIPKFMPDTYHEARQLAFPANRKVALSAPTVGGTLTWLYKTSLTNTKNLLCTPVGADFSARNAGSANAPTALSLYHSCSSLAIDPGGAHLSPRSVDNPGPRWGKPRDKFFPLSRFFLSLPAFSYPHPRDLSIVDSVDNPIWTKKRDENFFRLENERNIPSGR